MNNGNQASEEVHEKMLERRKGTGLMLLVGVIALLLGWHFFSDSTSAGQWTVSDEGILEYKVSMPQYNLSPPEDDGNSTLSTVQFQSRDAKIAALLRIPEMQMERMEAFPALCSCPAPPSAKSGSRSWPDIWQTWDLPASPLTREIWGESMQKPICRCF